METYKSPYDDTGKLIKDDQASSSDGSSAVVSDVALYQQRLKAKLDKEYLDSKNRVDNSYVMLSRIQMARKQVRGMRIE